MYFVRYGDICVRFTGKGWDERELPEFTSVYDYDDEKKYSLDDLERESRRTDFGGAGRDEDAHAAVVMELFRRKGGEENCLCTDWDDTLTLLEDDEGDPEGIDISSLAGAKAAQKFLENAGPEDAFVTEGPVDNEMDEFMGKMRLEAMLKCVKARIDQMIGGKK